MTELPEDSFEFHQDLIEAAFRVGSVHTAATEGELTDEHRAMIIKWLPKVRAMAEEMAELVRSVGEFSAGLAELRGEPKPDDVCECGHYYAQHSGSSAVSRYEGRNPRKVFCGEMIYLRIPGPDRPRGDLGDAYTCGCHWYRPAGEPMSEADREKHDEILAWAILTGWRDMFGREVYEPIPGRLSTALVNAYLFAHMGESYLL